MFSFSCLFGVRGSNHLLFFCPYLAVGPSSPEKTEYSGPAPSRGLVIRPNGRLSNRSWVLAAFLRRKCCVSVGGGKNHLLTPGHNWIHDCILDWHPELDPEVGPSLEYEYSMTHGTAKAAWYSPCVRWILDWMSGRSLGGKLRWVVGWVYGRIFSWCECDGMLLGLLMGPSLGRPRGDCFEILEWT